MGLADSQRDAPPCSGAARRVGRENAVMLWLMGGGSFLAALSRVASGGVNTDRARAANRLWGGGFRGWREGESRGCGEYRVYSPRIMR